MSLENVDWSNIPPPPDDGAASHLSGAKIPPIRLPASDGTNVELSQLAGRTVVYVYPRTGRPDQDLPGGWNMIPGARGCTPQSCAFRDHFDELRQLGIANLFGLSTQDSDYQREAVARLHLPFALLSDAQFRLADALNLPRFTADGTVLLRRLTLIIDDGVIGKTFYPVFPPDQNAADVIGWIREQS